MAGFGEGLRRERQMRRISLEEISETTKISVRFLGALESEDFSQLPGGIFVRSFIRAYANYLGLDADSIVAEYALVAPPPEEQDFSKLRASTGGLGRKKKKMPVVLPWLLAVVLLGGGYAIFRYAHRTSELPFTRARPVLDANAGTVGEQRRGSPLARPEVIGPAGATAGNRSAAVANQSDPPPNREQLRADSNHQEARPATRTSLALARLKARGKLVLQVAANQPSWVAVEADGKTVFEHVLAPDNVRTLIAKNYFDVTTANAQGTVLTLNGVTLKPLGRHGEVRRLHLTRKDLRRSTP